jgi:hypothetical protein
MKKNAAIIFALTFLCLINTTHAQYREINYLPDSIRIEFPDQRSFVIFEMRKFKDNSKFIETFPSRLTDLITYIKKALPSDGGTLTPKRIDINVTAENEKLILSSQAGSFYKPEGEKIEITVSEASQQTHITVKQNTIEQLLPPGWELYINVKNVKVTVYANSLADLEALSRQNFVLAVAALQSDPKIEYARRKRIQSRMVISQDKVLNQKIDYHHPSDMLFITGHAGVGLIQDNFYPELSISAGFYFIDRFNRKNHRVELIYNNKFFTKIKTESFELNTNSFLSVAYSKNFSYTKKDQWTTFGAGLLINRAGSYFSGKTAMFFISTDIGSSKLNLVPEFYLTEDFSKFAFGLKLNYTF